MIDDDPFIRLDCPTRFGIDDDFIRSRQREVLARLHPDRERDPVRRAMAMRESAAASSAARTLRDPALRAEWLMRLAGAGAAVPAPAELLMASLAWREAIEQGRSEGAEALAEARGPVEARLAEVLAELAEAIDGDGAGSPNSITRGLGNDRSVHISNPAQAAALLTELRLLRRLLEDPVEPHA